MEDSREVVLVDASTRRVVRRAGVPGRPHNVTVSKGGTVASTLQSAGTIALIRGDRVNTVELGGSPHDVKPMGDGFVIANEGRDRLDLVSESGKRIGTIQLRGDPHDVAVRNDRAWVTLNDSDAIAIVDLAGRAVVRYAQTGKRPHDLLLASDGRAWVTDWDGSTHVFEENGELVKTLSLGTEAHHLTFTPDGEETWVTDHRERRAFVVSTETLDVLASLEIRGAPHHVGVTSDGRWAGVADHDSGTLVVFDVHERREIAAIPVGRGPHGVWAQP